MKNNCICCSLRSYSKRWKFFRKGDDDKMKVTVYRNLYKNHVDFLQILGGVLDSIYTDYYFNFRDNSSYDTFKVKFSYHIITHTEQVILKGEFMRDRSMSNSSWMKMKYGLLKSFTVDLFKILMFNNNILGNSVGDLSDIMNSLRENPNLIQEGLGKLSMKDDWMKMSEDIEKDMNVGRTDSDVFPDSMFKGAEMEANVGPSTVYIEYSVDKKNWRTKMSVKDKFMRISNDGKIWTEYEIEEGYGVKVNDPKLTDLEESIIQKKANDFVEKMKNNG